MFCTRVALSFATVVSQDARQVMTEATVEDVHKAFEDLFGVDKMLAEVCEVCARGAALKSGPGFPQ